GQATQRTDSIRVTSVEGKSMQLRVRVLVLLVIALLLGSAAALRAAAVTAAWNANTDSDIGGYQLFYGTQTGVYTTTVDVGNVTSRAVTLTNGQRYYFAVKAYNTSSMTSAYSAEVFFDVPVSTTAAITSLSPASGPIGTSVTVTGTNFGATMGTSTATFDGWMTSPTMWSATSIVVPVPTSATTGNVVVTVGGGASNGVVFTVVPTPSLTSLAPTSGLIGTSVT